MIAGIVASQSRPVSQSTDPYWSSVVSLLHFDGAHASTTFADETARVWTAAGTAQISTARSKFGGASGLFDGSASVVGTASTAYDFGAGDFSIAGWIYISGNSAADADGARGATIVNTWNSGSVASDLRGWIFGVLGNSSTTGTGLQFDTWGGTSTATLYRATVSVSQSVWHHVEVTVSGGVRRLFLDGTLISGTTTTIGAGYTQANSQSSPPRIARTQRTSYPLALVGNVDDLIITRTVLHTASFTPPTGPYSL